MKKWFQTVDELETMPAFESPAFLRVITQLRIRAKVLKVSAVIVLALIVVLLATGFWVFSHAEVSASDIESRKTNELDAELSKAKVELRDVEAECRLSEQEHSVKMQIQTEEMRRQEERLKSLYEKQSSLQIIDPAFSNQLAQLVKLIGEAKGSIDEIAKQRKFDQDLSQLSYSQKNLTTLKEQVSTLEARRNYMIASGNNTTIFLGTLLSTKIGTTVLLLFLVQILVTLYRYNIRLASFYDSRADILQLVKGDGDNTMPSLASILAADRVEFGKVVPPHEANP